MAYKLAPCYIEGIRPHEPHIAHVASVRAALPSPSFASPGPSVLQTGKIQGPSFAAPGPSARQAGKIQSQVLPLKAFCTPGRKDRQPEMTLPRPMGRSTPSPAGARTEHRSPRVHSPLRARFPSMPKWPDGACQLTDSHRCIPDCHTPHRKNDVPSKAVGAKTRWTPPTALYNAVFPIFLPFFVFLSAAKTSHN